jgi:hypothetical protein
MKMLEAFLTQGLRIGAEMTVHQLTVVASCSGK